MSGGVGGIHVVILIAVLVVAFYALRASGTRSFAALLQLGRADKNKFASGSASLQRSCNRSNVQLYDYPYQYPEYVEAPLLAWNGDKNCTAFCSNPPCTVWCS